VPPSSESVLRFVANHRLLRRECSALLRRERAALSQPINQFTACAPLDCNGCQVLWFWNDDVYVLTLFFQTPLNSAGWFKWPWRLLFSFYSQIRRMMMVVVKKVSARGDWLHVY